MKVLVIGGCGYVGSAIYRHLDGQGIQVDSMDLELRGDAGILRNETINYRWAHGFQEWEIVIMVAGHSSVKASIVAPFEAFENNLAGLARLTQTLTGQPLIYASSAAVHDRSDQSNMYDVTKRAAEQVIPLLYPNSWGLRFGTVAGPSPNMRLDTVVNAMVSSALRTRKIHLSNENAWRPILGMDDLLAGIDRILAGRVGPGLHDMASFNMSIGNIADRVAEITGATIEREPNSATYDFEMNLSGFMWKQKRQTIDDIVLKLVAFYVDGALK